jgi:hypothetical protein
MKASLAAAIAAAGVLTVASGAAAKAPPGGFRLCGATSCIAIADDAERLAIALFYGDARIVAPPNAAPSDFYVLRWHFTDEAPGTAYYVAASGVVRLGAGAPGQFAAGGYWLRPNEAAITALSSLASRLEPVHPAAPARVTVGGRSVRDPGSYARVWTVGTLHLPVHPRGWIRVRFTTAAPTPWSDSMTDVEVARRGGWLARDGTFFRVPAKFAARIRARQSLR